jgi:hypothetical protein
LGATSQGDGKQGDPGTLGFIDINDNGLMIYGGWEFQADANYTNLTVYDTLTRINASSVVINASTLFSEGDFNMTCVNTGYDIEFNFLADANFSNTTIKNLATAGGDCDLVNLIASSNTQDYYTDLVIEANNNITLDFGANLTIDSSTLTLNNNQDWIILDYNPQLTLQSTTITGNLDWLLANFTIYSGSSISSNLRGCPDSQSPNKTTNLCKSFNTTAVGYGEGMDDVSDGGGGGAYGGRGGRNGNNESQGGLTYGDPLAPIFLGSGGGKGDSDAEGGTGGGAIKINVTGTFEHNGTITSNGGAGNPSEGNNEAGGGGSGGSIWIYTDNLIGNGSFSADGGQGAIDTGRDGGGGSGGRIAVYYNTISEIDISSSSVLGATSQGDGKQGDPGTLGFIDINDNGLMIYSGWEFQADANYTNLTVYDTLTRINASSVVINASTLFSEGDFNMTCVNTGYDIEFNFLADANFSNTTIKNLATAGGDCDLVNLIASSNTLGDIKDFTIEANNNITLNLGLDVIFNSAIITLNNNQDWILLTGQELTILGTALSGNFDWELDNLTIYSGSSISANSRGCPNSTSPNSNHVCENQGTTAVGYGEGMDDINDGGGGGAYGGRGGRNGNNENQGGLTYGDPLAPMFLGSGGGEGDSDGEGGTGGGAIKINVTDTFEHNGTITSNGGAGDDSETNNEAGGGGSGGSIWIYTDNLIGNGSFSADGGQGASDLNGDDGGGGSGGRIAVYYNTISEIDISNSSVLGATSLGNGKQGDPGTLGFIDIDQNNLFIKDGWEFQADANYTNITVYDTLTRINASSVVINASTLFSEGDFNMTCVNTGYDIEFNFLADANFSNTTIKNLATAGVDCDLVNLIASSNTQDYYTDLVIEANNNITLDLGTDLTFDSSTLTLNNNQDWIILDYNPSLILQSTSITGNLDWLLANFTIYSGSSISANSRGCPNSTSPNSNHVCENQGTTAVGYGEGMDDVSDGGGGAGYGGRGGRNGNNENQGGYGYGDALAPMFLGSGGGEGDTDGEGGTGGGIIRINVTDTFEHNGTITSDGGVGDDSETNNEAGGGGSGGSIWIITDILSGNGSFTADGGQGASDPSGDDGGGGSGGRIAVFYNTKISTSTIGGSVEGATSLGNGKVGDMGTLIMAGAYDTDYNPFGSTGLINNQTPVQLITNYSLINLSNQINRTINSTWSNVTMVWNDSASNSSTIAWYNMTGLKASTNYTMSDNLIEHADSPSETDASGTLALFNVSLSSEHMVDIVELVYPNVTNIIVYNSSWGIVNYSLALDSNVSFNVSITNGTRPLSDARLVIWEVAKNGDIFFNGSLTYVNGIYTLQRNITSPLSTIVYYTVYANDTLNYSSEMDGNFTLLGPPVIRSVYAAEGGFLNGDMILQANVSDDNLATVNFTIMRNDSTVLAANHLGSNHTPSLWNATTVTLTNCSIHNYTVVAYDTDGYSTTSTGNITFDCITLDINPNPVNNSDETVISGQVTQNDDSVIGDNQVNVYLDGTLQTAPLGWWNLTWNYRTNLTVDTGYTIRGNNTVVKALINFSSLLDDLGVTETLDNNSIRVLDWSGTEMPSDILNWQELNSTAMVRWALTTNGSIDKETNFTYYVYFDTVENGNKTVPSYTTLPKEFFICSEADSNYDFFYAYSNYNRTIPTSWTKWTPDPNNEKDEATIFDKDNDGDYDIAWTSDDENKFFVYENNGDDSWSFSETESFTSVDYNWNGICEGDFNEDGYLDLIVNDDNCVLLYYENDGDGTFSYVSSPGDCGGEPRKIACGDLDNDNNIDILAGAASDGLYWIKGDGDGTFTADGYIADSNTYANKDWHGIWIVDNDNDGDMDVYAQPNSAYVTYFQNNGGGSFANGVDQPDGGLLDASPAQNNWGSGTVGDYDNDGVMDLIDGSWSGTSYFYAYWGNPNNLTDIFNGGNPTAKTSVTVSEANKMFCGGQDFLHDININLTNQAEILTTTNTTGHYTYNLTAPATGGTYEIQVNATSYTGQGIDDLIVHFIPVINSVETNISAYELASLYLITNLTDDNTMSVNFTITDPDGIDVIDNVNGTKADVLWNSSAFTLDKNGTYTYEVNATDATGYTASTSGSIDFVLVSLLLSSNPLDINTNVTFSGHVNLTNGTELANTSINIYFNGTLQGSSILGDGSDGDLTVSAANTIINNYTYLMGNESSGNLTIIVNDSSEFVAGDEILIIQMQNSSGGIAGQYEFVDISSISDNNITLISALNGSYFSGTFNTSSSTVTQVVRVPEYTTVDVDTGASIIAPAWDGWSGGIIVFKATDTITVEGAINVSEIGYRGGTQVPAESDYQYGHAGERTIGVSSARESSSSAISLGGAGAGKGGDGSGGGGGYGAAGTDGAKYLGSSDYGRGAGAFGIANLSLIYFGGAGGSAGSHSSSRIGVAGGNGGGILIIYGASIQNTGQIIAKGQKGSDGVTGGDSNRGAGGGGGAGGSIYLVSEDINTSDGIVNASGELGGIKHVGSNGKDGGNGSVGRIRLDFTTLTGTSDPVNGYNETYSNSEATTTNGTADYSYNLTALDTPGTYPVVVNLTSGNLFGQSSTNLVVQQAPTINSVTTNTTAYIDQSIYLIANITDENLMSVNFTITDPDGIDVIDNVNGTEADVLWNSSDFTLSKPGTYTYEFNATDANGLTASTSGSIDFILVSLALNQSPVNINANVTVFGHINLTNGTNVANAGFNTYLNGTLQGSSSLGDGSDGDLTVSAANTIINNYTYLTGNESSGNLTIAVNNASEFIAGDEILIIQMQNLTNDTAGQYEFLTISSKDGNNITLTSALTKSYSSGIFNTTNATTTQIVRIPKYTSVTINSGASITAQAWDGWSGGIVMFKSSGLVNITGDINVSAKGFRGGISRDSSGPEGYDGFFASGGGGGGGGGGGHDGSICTGGSGADGAEDGGSSCGSSNPGGDGITGGGGGGMGGGWRGPDGGATGGDGATPGTGGNGGSTTGTNGANAAGGGASGSNRDDGAGGGGGRAFDARENNAPSNLSLLHLGGGASQGAGGGGGGGEGDNRDPTGGSGGSKDGTGGDKGTDLDEQGNSGGNGTSGEAGGGLVFIYADELIIDGFIDSTGGDGGDGGAGANGNVNGGGAGGGGGGGNGAAGGSIYIATNTLDIGTDKILLSGGAGGAGGSGATVSYTAGDGAAGSSGSNGTLRLDFVSLTGSTSYGFYNETASLTTGSSTNGTGDYSVNITALSTSGTYPIIINITSGLLFGQSTTNLVVQQAPTINSVTTNTTAYIDQNIYLIANMTDDNLIEVNFTITDPDGIDVIDNVNGTQADVLWNSSAFTLSKPGQYTYEVNATDADGFTDSTSGSIDFIIVGLSLNPNPVNISANTIISGHVNITNTTNVTNTAVYIYLNGTLQMGESWFDSDWPYRKSITILENSGDDLTDFQVNLTINTTELIEDGKLNANCSDIRFGDSNGNEIFYWIENESLCNDSATKVWVKTNLTASQNNTIYLYYGNTDGINQSNGTNVFEFFDDFNSGSIDLSKWTTGGGTISIVSGRAKIVPATADPDVNAYIRSVDDVIQPNITIHYKIEQEADEQQYLGLSRETDPWNGTYWEMYYSNYDNNLVYYRSDATGYPGTSVGAVRYATNTIVNLTIQDTVMNYSDGQGGTDDRSINSNIALPNNLVFFARSVDIIGAAYIDDVYINKYISSQPSVTSIGVEDSITTNSTGDYSVNLTAFSTPGTYPVIVNITSGSFYGESSTNLVIQQSPTINSVTINSTAYLDQSIYLIANMTDENLIEVNFTVTDPDGIDVINNQNGTQADVLWNSSEFTLSKPGQYTYEVNATDADGLTASTSGSIDFIIVGLNLNPNPVNISADTVISGHINLTNTTNVTNTIVNIYLNGTLQTTISNVGDGSDGSLTVSTSDMVVNNYTYLTGNESSGNSTITVNDASAFSANDEILIIQIRNDSGGIVGEYEFVDIASINGANLTLSNALTKSFYSGTIGTSSATITQVIRVPQYTSVTIDSGASITSPAWNGSIGGIVVFRATGLVNIIGSIDVNATGYRGGSYTTSDTATTLYLTNGNGEGLSYGRVNPQVACGDGCGRGATGAGYATVGANSPRVNALSITYGYENLSLLYYGAGGGGGNNNGAGGPADGGAGGGIIYISANIINISGDISSNGGAGQDYDNGAGGGAAGGSIYLSANTLNISTDKISTTGGAAGDSVTDNNHDGGAGGKGRIRLDYNALSGSVGSSYYGSYYNSTFEISELGLLTNSTADYSYNLTAPDTPGTYPVVVNITSGSFFGESSTNLIVQQAPTINSVETNTTAYLDQSIYLIANMTDENLIWVNFTVTDPDGIDVIDNVNGTVFGDLWNTTGFTLSKPGTYNYEVNATDVDGLTASTSGSIDFIIIGLNLNPNPVNISADTVISGHINLTNTTNVTNTAVSIYFNGTLQSPSGWFNITWPYRKQVDIESLVSENLINILALVNFSTTSEISDSKMNANCSDIRFADADGNELQHTFETSTCNSSNTISWVWVNLTNNTNTTIYAYYGNSNADIKTDYTNPDENLILYMHFDNSNEYGESGSLVYDFSKNGNNGTFAGNANVSEPGTYGNSLGLDGTGDYVTASDSEFPLGSSSRTISALVKWDGTTTRRTFIGYGSNSNTQAYGYRIGNTGTGEVEFIGYNAGDGTTLFTMAANVWTHLVSTYDGTNVRTYVNGSLVSTQTLSLNTVSSSGFRVGWGYDNNAATFPGYIDEVRVYNKTLNQSEILSIYNSTKPYVGTEAEASSTNSTADYSLNLTAPDTPGTYPIIVNITSGAFFGESSANLIVANMTDDISINQTLIFDPTSPAENQTVTINATVYGGSNNYTDVNVSLYIDNVFINNSVINLSPSSTEFVLFNWNATPQNRTIMVALDANNTIYETNESNNNVTNYLWVTKVAVLQYLNPENATEIIRGKTDATEEDPEEHVTNETILQARIYNLFDSTEGILANCTFYFNNTLLGGNLTNSDGYCNRTFYHSIYAAGDKNLTVNFTDFNSSFSRHTENVEVNNTLIITVYETTLATENTRFGNIYRNGDAAVLFINTTKDDVLEDVNNFTLEVRKSSPDAVLITQTYPGDIQRLGVGQYRSIATVNDTFVNTAIHWKIYVDDNQTINNTNQSTIINATSGSHSDVDIQTATATLNISIFNESNTALHDTRIILEDRNNYELRDMQINDVDPTLQRPGTLNDKYKIKYTTQNGTIIDLTEVNLTTTNLTIVPQVVQTYTGDKPGNSPNLTTIVAINSTEFNFTNATISIPFNNLNDRGIRYIYHCLDWDFNNAECNNWEENLTSDYADYSENATHFSFTVTSFTGYAGGDGYNANMTIDNNGPQATDVNITFNTSYINSTSGVFITSAYCNISFNDSTTFVMAEMSNRYEYNKSFSSSGNYSYNVTCNHSVYDTLNASDNTSVSADIGAPSVTLTAPINNNFTNLLNITFGCYANDTNLNNISLYHNISQAYGINQTNTVSGADVDTEFNVTETPDGYYAWNCLAYDVSGNDAFATNNFTVTVDTITPNVTIGINDTTPEFSIDSLIIDWNTSDINQDSEYLNITYPNGTLLTSSTDDSVDITLTTTNLSVKGTYTVNAFANDSATNSNTTTTIFTVQNTVSTQGTPILNSTYGNNLTNENLTVYNVSTSSPDEDPTKNIINWFVNDTSITVLNIPFEADGADNASDYSSYQNNGTVTGATWNATGGYDGKGAFEFDGSGYINTSDFADTVPITISTWVYATAFTEDTFNINTIIGKENGVDDSWVLRVGDSGISQNQLQWVISESDEDQLKLNGPLLNTDQWYHIVVTYDSTGNQSIYLDGNNTHSQLTADGTMENSNTAIEIGRSNLDNGRVWKGKIDEVQIFNRSLSPEQVQALYNNRTDLIASQETVTGDIWNATITPNDGTNDGTTKWSNALTILADNPPTVTLVSPPNQNFTSTNITFICNATDLNLNNISLYHNISQAFGFNQTNATPGTAAQSTFVVNNTPDGNHTWNCLAYDIYGNSAFASSNNTITVDTTAPNVTLLTPLNNSIWNTSYDVDFIFNVTDVLSNQTNCSLFINDTYYQGNDTVTNITNNYTQTLVAGNYTWFISCFDSASNTQNSTIRNISVISLFGSLNITWLEPTANINVNQNEFFEMQVNVSCADGPCGNITITLDPEEANETINETINNSTNTTNTNTTQTNETEDNETIEEVLDDITQETDFNFFTLEDTYTLGETIYFYILPTNATYTINITPMSGTLNNLEFTPNQTGIYNITSTLNFENQSESFNLTLIITEQSNKTIETNTTAQTYEEGENITQEDKHLGEKLEDEIHFETYFASMSQTNTTLTVIFYHDYTQSLPVWIEGDITYQLSTTNAEPYENTTLEVTLVEGIIPRFNLHLGEESEIFEFGKVIPDVDIDHGETELIDRIDEKLDINITKNNNTIKLEGIIDETDIYSYIEPTDQFATDIVAVEPLDIEQATITLQATTLISAIFECPDEYFNYETLECDDWQETNISFTQDDNLVEFTVTHFSGYAGGNLSNNQTSYLTIWDELDQGEPNTTNAKLLNQNTLFFADYKITQNLSKITDGNCTLNFSNTLYQMNYNTSYPNYVANRSFATAGQYTYTVTCTHETYDNLTATDTIRVPTNKGVVPTTPSTPFYTNASNPQTCLEMNETTECLITWWVNATGEPVTYEFYAYADSSYTGDVDSVNSSFLNITILSNETTAPLILTANSTPIIVYTGQNISLVSTASDNTQVDTCYANITLPNASIVQYNNTCTAQQIHTTDALGTHNITFVINDTSGNIVTDTYNYFIVYPPINFTTSMNSSNGSLNAHVQLYHTDTQILVREDDINGSYNETIPDTTYDVLYQSYGERFQVRLRQVNMSDEIQNNFGMDKLSTPSTGYLLTYAIDTNYTFTNATVTVYYDDVNYTNEDGLILYKCDDWDFNEGECDGTWEDVTDNSTQDTTSDFFTYLTSTFSGFSVGESSSSSSSGISSGGAGNNLPTNTTNTTNVTQSEECIPDWQCGDWGECNDNLQRRYCSDINNCNSPVAAPHMIEECEPTETTTQTETTGTLTTQSTETKTTTQTEQEIIVDFKKGEKKPITKYTYLVSLVILMAIMLSFLMKYGRNKGKSINLGDFPRSYSELKALFYRF